MIYPIITGLDIGHHSIKAVSVRLKKGQFELISSDEVLLPESVFLDMNTLHMEEIIPYLSRLKTRIKRNLRQVAFSIPDSSIISKIIRLDGQLDEEETEFAIIHAFEQQTSFLADDLNIDYIAIDQRGVDSEKITNFQVFAVKKELIQARQKCVASVGFIPILADAHSHALLTLWQRSVTVYPDKKNWMLIDIGHLHTIFCVISPNQQLYTKSIIFGASQLMGNRPIEYLTAVEAQDSSQFTALLSEHISRQITLYSSIHNHKIEGLWITGGGAALPGLSDVLSYELSLPILELALSSLFHCTDQQVMRVNAPASQYASAIGLALRGVEWLTK
ncbi:type IV pilus assembly protein PilM [uncultured Aliivibrio sp.]|uniref:type IV pilus biogenesis protein PilM n=1 Tax=uncultured Aliivibrio sp. TaxID=873085 RepID=UPI002602A324|nr:type IV pilus assembly protein PilM [uncultured Aliivibrio sp.]